MHIQAPRAHANGVSHAQEYTAQADSDDEDIRQLEKPLPEELALGQSSNNEVFRMDPAGAEVPGDSWPDASLPQQPVYGSSAPDAGQHVHAIQHLCQSCL